MLINEKKLYPAICYKLKEPIIYYKGTKQECNLGDDFLAYYFCGNEKTPELEVEKLNKERPAFMKNGTPIDWSKVNYFYVNMQEDMY